MIHVKGDINEEQHNEACMMHTCHFSALRYRSVCTNRSGDDEGNAGKRLINGSVERAIKFRKEKLNA